MNLRDRSLLYGRRAVLEYLRETSHQQAGQAIQACYIQDNLPVDLLRQVQAIVSPERIHSYRRRELDEKFASIRHQGLIIEFQPGAEPGRVRQGLRNSITRPDGLLLLLDRIQDVHNAGAIVRSAEVLGARAVVFTGIGVDAGGALHRSSSGASLHMELYQESNLHNVVRTLKKIGYWICASTSSETDDARAHTNLAELPDARELALIIGNESAGIKPIVLKECDYRIHIPTSGRVASLNASVAAALLMDRLINR